MCSFYVNCKVLKIISLRLNQLTINFVQSVVMYVIILGPIYCPNYKTRWWTTSVICPSIFKKLNVKSG